VLDIYRKYYGWKMMGFLFATFYVAMAGAAYVVDAIFAALGLTPSARHMPVMEAAASWNYTTWLDLAFLCLAAVLLWRFFTTGGPAMLRMMDKADMGDLHHDHHHHHEH
jgi:uncharacterized membrane protein YraQ (UPF0718 family)